MKNFALIVLIFFISCSKSNLDSEQVLREFAESRIDNVVSKKFVLERVTGRMKESFENMSDEDFTKFADMKNIKSQNFKIHSKTCQENKCFITYSIAYLTMTGEKGQFSSEVKKIAEMQLINNKWLISDINNIKTYHESLVPISP